MSQTAIFQIYPSHFSVNFFVVMLSVAKNTGFNTAYHYHMDFYIFKKYISKKFLT
jgi:hypothetical protein